MLYFLVFLYAIYTIYKILLSVLELRFVQKKMNQKAVVLSEEDYKKAAKTKIVNERFEIFSNIYAFICALFWIFIGIRFLFTSVVKEDTIMQNLIFVMLFLILNSVFSLPLDIYKVFVKDKKLGFSNSTPKIFITDNIKNLVLTAVFGSVFVWVLLMCIKWLGNLWWFWAFLVSFAIILVINLIYPVVIAPIFNKMSPLQDGELKSSIETLLNKCGFKSSGVFVIDASKRDKRLNAYFGGLGATKRVVLFDTLIQKLSTEEILAVLGHELGHFMHGDILKNIALQFVLFAILFAVFGNLPEEVYGALGISYTGGAILVFLMLFTPILMAFLEPLISKISRSHEFLADEFGGDIQSKNDMINALVKLGSQNRAFPISHPVYSAVYHSHPSLYERINELQK